MRNAPYHVEDMLLRTGEHWPEADTVATRLVNRLFRLRDLLLEESTKEMSRFELSPVEFAVLASLRKLGAPHEMRPSDMYNAMFVTSGGMTKILNELEARKLIERLPDPNDRRSVRVRLTAAGKVLIEATMAAVQTSEATMLARAADASTIAALADNLEVFTATLDR